MRPPSPVPTRSTRGSSAVAAEAAPACDPGHAAATRLLVIRHGQTDWNAQARMQGHRDIALNAQGQREAAALARALAHEAPARVVSSDLQRARQTALAFADPLGWTVERDPALRERAFGDYEGLTLAEIAQRDPEGAAAWQRRDPRYAPPGGGESLEQFRARVEPALRCWLDRTRGGLLVVVTHGGVADLVHRMARGLALHEPRTWTMRNASIHRLVHTDESLVVQAWDDTSHLDGVATGLDEHR